MGACCPYRPCAFYQNSEIQQTNITDPYMEAAMFVSCDLLIGRGPYVPVNITDKYFSTTICRLLQQNRTQTYSYRQYGVRLHITIHWKATKQKTAKSETYYTVLHRANPDEDINTTKIWSRTETYMISTHKHLRKAWLDKVVQCTIFGSQNFTKFTSEYLHYRFRKV